MNTLALRAVLLFVVPLAIVCTPAVSDTFARLERPLPDVRESAREFKEDSAVTVYYLEIVTPEVDATCDALEKVHGVSFGEPIAELGQARTATSESGGRVGVRAPMRETEEPVVRPYVLVDDIEAAVDAARAAGGEIAMPPTEIPGQGKFAIYILGGIQHGLWQL
jgi:predicted enzyme related to lactoylglutathione lyase